MSRFGARKGRKLPGQEFTWDNEPGAEPDTAPTPLFPKYTVPHARLLSPREQIQVDYYRQLRERFHEGPDYAVRDAVTATARRDTPARANFDPFHGMPSYSGRYQKKQRTVPRVQGRSFILKFFPQELWKTIQPSFKPDSATDGYVGQMKKGRTLKRGFEDDEDDEDDATKRRRAGDDDDEGEQKEGAEDGDRDVLDEDEEQEEEIVDDDFEDDEDELGGDYNAEQYFDGGDDEMGDDGFADGGPGAGDEDTF
ncbi:hypothetical protein PHISP_00741 [Aspergillus sp. HF37]|nr:hypothetical protein PHISP_00741 [Aspergillus sp. HF37]